MTRTKWMRLGVSDPADILRWAGAQSTRRLDDFRHRVIRGREFVSFRMVPRYAIEIGTSDIIVVAHVRPRARQRLMASVAALGNKAARRASAAFGALRPRGEPVVHNAQLYRLDTARLSSPFRG
jgi:hypothetical protein